MSKRRHSMSMVVLLVAFASAGCRDDVPPPTSNSAKAAKSAKIRSKARADLARGKVRRISPQAMKQYRLDVCRFGTMGLQQVRDTYLASMGDAQPGPDKIPSFGEAEKKGEQAKTAAAQPATGAPATAKATDPASPQATAKAAGADKAAPGTRGPMPDLRDSRARPIPFAMRMPHTRYVRSCTIAKKLKQPAVPELDQALEHFEEYVTGVHKALTEAHRYYSRKQHEKDEFKRGKELHGELTKAFETLDEELATFGAAVDGWRAKQTPAPDKLDAAGETAEGLVAEARALTLLVLAKGEKDAEAYKKAMARLTKAQGELEAQHEKDDKAPHPRVLKAPLDAFVEAATTAQTEIEAGKVESKTAIDVAMKFVALTEASHRALARLLNPRSAKPRGPGGARVRPKNLKGGARKAGPKPPPPAPKPEGE